MKDKISFEHRKIRWGRELLGLIQYAIVVVATGFIFGWDSPAWERVLALMLIVSAAHSLVVVGRGEQPLMETSPWHVKAWHSTWFMLGVIGSIWLYDTTGPILATALNFFFWGFWVLTMAVAEKKERIEMLDAQEIEV